MIFELKFPDSCYFEDQKHYDLFVYKGLQAMLDRMATSHNKYQQGRPMDEVVEAIDEVKSAKQRIAMYKLIRNEREGLCNCEHEGYSHQPNCFLSLKKLDTGNTENLLDAANMLVIESILPKHPKAHFKAQSASDSPGLEYLP